MDVKGEIAAGGSEYSTTEGGESKHKGDTEGAARFPACATGGQKAKDTNGGGKHRGVTESRQDQGGLGSPHAVVPTSEGKTFPPNQGGPGTSVRG